MKQWAPMCSRGGSKIKIQIQLDKRIIPKLMNTTTKWSSQIQQSIRIKLNKKLSELQFNTKMCIYPVSTTANTNVLSCNMPQYKANQQSMSKVTQHWPHKTKDTK
jgi:ATP-dependent protease HslVU (ClpYQ) ATPase subunit